MNSCYPSMSNKNVEFVGIASRRRKDRIYPKIKHVDFARNGYDLHLVILAEIDKGEKVCTKEIRAAG